MADREPQLRQELYGVQIFVRLPLLQHGAPLLIPPQMIAFSAVVGITVFYHAGEAVEVAGPGGTLLAFLLLGIISICVMEGVSEMIQMFPAPNAIMEYIRAFVDPDWAWVIGIAYWYFNSSASATLIIVASEFTSYWGLSKFWKIAAFNILAPVVMLFINFAGVKYFGWIETVAGFLKGCMVLGTGFLMYVIHAKGQITRSDPNARTDNSTAPKYIEKGFAHDPYVTKDNVQALCYIFPIIAYGFIGLEMTAITAFEARDLHSLRRSSQFLAYVIFGIYMFCIIGELLNVEWSNPGLPLISGDPSRNSTGTGKIYKTDSILIIAALNAGYKKFPGLLSGFLIFAALSSANSALYVASRSLYGMTRTVNPWKWFRWLRVLGSVWYRTGVPMWALLFSAMAFIWLPFLKIHGGDKTTHLIQIMTTTSSVSCLIVWASLCLAYIRYHAWIKKHREEVARVYPEYDRWSDSSQASTFLAGLQPLPAWVGLVGCLGTIFVCTTATWWSTHATAQKVAVAYGASSKLEKPIILAILFVVLKLITRRLPVRLDDDSNRLLSTLEHLRYLKPERRSR